MNTVILYKIKKQFIKTKNKVLLNGEIKKAGECICGEKADISVLEKRWSNKRISCYDDEALGAWDGETELSVIVPLYNAVDFTERCANAFIDQKTERKFEVIFINDGSKDNTLENISKFAAKYSFIKVFTQENRGISATRNRGLKLAGGKYIGFADQDDWVDCDYVEKLLSIAEKENADIVKCAFRLVKGCSVREIVQGFDETITGEMKAALVKYPSYIWSGIYKRELFAHLRFPDGYWYEDMIVRSLLFRQAKKFVNTKRPMYNKFLHTGNASHVVWSDKSYQCLEQLYLPGTIIETSNKMGLAFDGYFYQCILLEFSNILVSRTKGLPDNERKQVFLCASDMLARLHKEEYDECLNKRFRRWNEALLNKKYELWLLLAKIN